MKRRQWNITDTTLCIKQNVLRLQVTVDDAERMQMLNGKRQFSQVETATTAARDSKLLQQSATIRTILVNYNVLENQ